MNALSGSLLGWRRMRTALQTYSSTLGLACNVVTLLVVMTCWPVIALVYGLGLWVARHSVAATTALALALITTGSLLGTVTPYEEWMFLVVPGGVLAGVMLSGSDEGIDLDEESE